MATVYFSTEATLSARVSSKRLTGYIDFDGDDSPDDASLTSAFQKAKSIILGYLSLSYDETVLTAWDSDTVPDLPQWCSDDISLWQIYSSNPVFAEILRPQYDEAITMLKAVVSGEMEIFGVDRATPDIYAVDRIPSDFDPERELDDMSVRVTWDAPDLRELEGY